MRSGLIEYVTNVKLRLMRDGLEKYHESHNKSKRKRQSSVPKEFDRSNIDIFSKLVFWTSYDKAEKCDQKAEACCAWNEMSGEALCTAIVAALFRNSKLLTKDILIGKDYKDERKIFYDSIERCCQVLIKFGRKISWPMAIYLAYDVFITYPMLFEEKKPSPTDLCTAMEVLADELEEFDFVFIYEKYQEYIPEKLIARDVMLGYDMIARKGFDSLWEDEWEYLREYYRNEVSPKDYKDRKLPNMLYDQVFQTVYGCLNGK